MLPWELIVCFFLGLALIFILGRALLIPTRFVWRLAGGGILGGLMLWLFNRFAFLTGLTLPVNPFTALIAGCLGAPGLGLVLLRREELSPRLLLGHQGFAYGCVDGAFI